MREQSERHCWLKRKVREEDNEEIRKQPEIRVYRTPAVIFYIWVRQDIWYPLRKLTFWRGLRGYGKPAEALENDLQ